MRVLIKQKEERNASDNLQKIWRSLDKQLGCIIKKKKNDWVQDRGKWKEFVAVCKTPRGDSFLLKFLMAFPIGAMLTRVGWGGG